MDFLDDIKMEHSSEASFTNGAVVFSCNRFSSFANSIQKLLSSASSMTIDNLAEKADLE